MPRDTYLYKIYERNIFINILYDRLALRVTRSWRHVHVIITDNDLTPRAPDVMCCRIADVSYRFDPERYSQLTIDNWVIDSVLFFFYLNIFRFPTDDEHGIKKTVPLAISIITQLVRITVKLWQLRE